MPLHLALLAALLVLVSGWNPADGEPRAEEARRQERSLEGARILRGGWLFDVHRGEMVRNTGIVVRAGRLLEVGADFRGRDLSGARILDLGEDDYILPGFFDLHAHYAVDLFGDGRVDETNAYPLLFLANGVTSTFPAGEMDPDRMRELQRAIDRGERPGPRIFRSGPYFGTARPGWDPATTPQRIASEVDRWAEQGVRGFKAKGIRADQLEALVQAAHRHGLTVTGHLGSGYRGTVNPREAIQMGIDRIEHFLGGDLLPADRPAYASLERLDPADPGVADALAGTIDLYRSHGVFFDATLTAYGYFGEQDPEIYEDFADERRFLTPYARRRLAERPPRRVNPSFERIFRVKLRTVKAFYDAGGGDWITLGTDHPSWGQFFSPFGVHRELHALVRAGIPPASALRIASWNGARALGVSDRLGSIEPGKWADLVVVRGNPLEEIRRTRNVLWVMKGGDLFVAEALQTLAEGGIGPASEAEEPAWRPAAPRKDTGAPSAGRIGKGSETRVRPRSRSF